MHYPGHSGVNLQILEQQHKIVVQKQLWKTSHRQAYHQHTVGGSILEQWESIIEVYKDLWRSEEGRESRSRYGIANENVRKLISKDDSANKAATTDGVLDLSVANRCNRMKIPLGKILCDNGPYAPYGMCDFEYRILLPSAEKLKVAQDGEDIGTYKLTDVQIEFETIESTALAQVITAQEGP